MFLQPLSSNHDRSQFSCGKPALDDWLKTKAGQAEKRGSARTYVLCEDGEEGVVGYYAVAAHTVAYGDAPSSLVKRHPKSGLVPAILLAKLAVDLSYQGRGLGERLLADAVGRTVVAADSVGVSLFVVDAIDTEAQEFYQQYGFEAWPAENDVTRLFARVADLRLAMSS